MDTKVAGDTGTREYIDGDGKFDGDDHVYYQSWYMKVMLLMLFVRIGGWRRRLCWGAFFCCLVFDDCDGVVVGADADSADFDVDVDVDVGQC